MNTGLLSTAGLGGVWAESNTREAIFAAMQRKETFGTSGVRMMKTGYAKGVPMGGDVPKKAGKEPTFIVWAVKDPDDANLDRIQILKVGPGVARSSRKSMTWHGPAIASPIRPPAECLP